MWAGGGGVSRTPHHRALRKHPKQSQWALQLDLGQDQELAQALLQNENQVPDFRMLLRAEQKLIRDAEKAAKKLAKDWDEVFEE